MKWSKDLVKYWCEYYYQLRNYELLPFEKHYVFLDCLFTAGSNPSISPYEETCDLNWEFDCSLKKMGERGTLFKSIYIDGEGKPDKKLFDEFCQTLRGENEDNP